MVGDNVCGLVGEECRKVMEAKACEECKMVIGTEL